MSCDEELSSQKFDEEKVEKCKIFSRDLGDKSME